MNSIYKLFLFANISLYLPLLILLSFSGWYHYRLPDVNDLKQCKHCELKFDLFEHMSRSPVYWFDENAKTMCHFCYNSRFLLDGR